MGLTVAVGLYAQNLADDAEEAKFLNEPFVQLNEVLAENGLRPHQEPVALSQEDYFSADIMGYGGVHALRRLAAYIAMKGRLPEPMPYGSHSDDPIYAEFNIAHDKYLDTPSSKGFLGLFRKRLSPPPFQHLVMHSDAEGFYVPHALDGVIVDWSQPQRPGLGMMVGSSVALLAECEQIAKSLHLPDNFDPDGEEFSDLLEEPASVGEPWQILPVEAHTVAHLASAARASLKLGAVIQFC